MMSPENSEQHLCRTHCLGRRDFLAMLSRLMGGFAGASTLGAASWLTGCRISNRQEEPALKIGYLPITDATPLLIGHSQGFFQKEGLVVEKPVLMRGWSEIAEGFLAGTFNLVHLLIPVPIFMRYGQNHPVKIIAWNHINGSALTVGLKSGIKDLQELGGKQIAVPYWYSMHNIILQLCLRKFGIEAVVQDRAVPLRPNQTNLFVMKPPDMPTAMSTGAIDGYIVAEPFNAAGEVLAKGTIVRFTGDVFKNHPCCVAVMHEEDIQKYPGWAQRVLNGLVKSQQWASGNMQQTAHILSKDGNGYLPLPEAIIQRAMSKYDLATYGSPGGTGAIQHPDWGGKRIGFQPYPYESATREVIRLLKQTHLEGDSGFLAGLDAERVVTELFNYDMVKRAAESVGGLPVFEGVDAKNPYVRAEIVEV